MYYQIGKNKYLTEEKTWLRKKQETIEDILDRIMDDIEMIREKCVCNGDENYEPEEDEYYDEDSSDDEDEQ
jgi:excinuclease UvrABC helicase subunit UvrB